MPPSALSLAVNTPTILCQTVRGVISTDALWEERQSGETSGGNQKTDETAGSLQTGYLSVSVLLFVCLFVSASGLTAGSLQGALQWDIGHSSQCLRNKTLTPHSRAY